MNNDDDKNDYTGWLRGVSLRLGAGGRTRQSGDHNVAPQTGEMGLFAGTPLGLMLHALESAGVDWEPSFNAIKELSEQEQRLLEDKAVKPSAFNIPRPDGFGEEEHAKMCSSLAAGIRETKDFKKMQKDIEFHRRSAMIGWVLVGITTIAAVVALFK